VQPPCTGPSDHMQQRFTLQLRAALQQFIVMVVTSGNAPQEMAAIALLKVN
jgi:hypothetical protein